MLKLCVFLSLCLLAANANRILLQHKESTPTMQMKFSGTVDAASIKDTEIIDLIAHNLGLMARNHAPVEKFAPIDLWHLPRANVLFALPGVDSGEESFASFGADLDIELSPESVDPVSALFTAFSGVEASEHGILAKAWPTTTGHKVEALIGSAGIPLNGNFHDLLATSFEESGRQFSFSYDRQYAAASMLHPSLRSLVAEESILGLYWDTSLERIASLNGPVPKEFDFDFDDIKTYLQGTDNSYTLNSFDLNNEASRAFIAELGFVDAAVEAIVGNHDREQVSPDSVVAIFSSLELLAAEYGKSSDQYAVASAAIAALVKDSTARLASSYSRILSEVVFFTEAERVTDEQVLSKVAEFAPVSHEYLPYIYDTSEQDTCQLLSSALESSNVEAVCMSEAFSRFVMAEPVSTGRTESEVVAFQTILWSSVIIVVALIAASMMVFAVEIPEDSILIRQTPHLFKDNM